MPLTELAISLSVVTLVIWVVERFVIRKSAPLASRPSVVKEKPPQLLRVSDKGIELQRVVLAKYEQANQWWWYVVAYVDPRLIPQDVAISTKDGESVTICDVDILAGACPLSFHCLWTSEEEKNFRQHLLLYLDGPALSSYEEIDALLQAGFRAGVWCGDPYGTNSFDFIRRSRNRFNWALLQSTKRSTDVTPSQRMRERFYKCDGDVLSAVTIDQYTDSNNWGWDD